MRFHQLPSWLLTSNKTEGSNTFGAVIIRYWFRLASLKVSMIQSVSRIKSESGGTHSFNGFFSWRNRKKPVQLITPKMRQPVMNLYGCLAIKRPYLFERFRNSKGKEKIHKNLPEKKPFDPANDQRLGQLYKRAFLTFCSSHWFKFAWK